MIAETDRLVSVREAFWTWCRVAALSFGGPAGQIAVMHRIIVDEKKWIEEQRFLHALNFCMLLPGPEAQQLAIYIGWLMHRTFGGLMAGILFVLPGFISILALSIVYASYGNTDLVQAIFFGLKPAVVAIVFAAVYRIGSRVLKNRTMIALAVIAFIAIHFFGVPFPLLIFAAGAIGFVGGIMAPDRFFVIKGHGGDKSSEDLQARLTANHSGFVSWIYSLRVVAICLPLWIGPTVLMGHWFGSNSVFYQEGVFFSKAALVTFGGAYSVLAYIAQKAVDDFGWLRPGEMLDGLGMAETTPGPLIMVVQFVGFMGAYRNPGPLEPLFAGLVGSVLTTWVTFVPCFLWIFLGAPYVDKLRGNQVLSSALSAITAAVVGVIFNLALWFTLHTLFSVVEPKTWGAIKLLIPQLSSINLAAVAITVIACQMTFYWKKGMVLTLTVSVLLGIVIHFCNRVM